MPKKPTSLNRPSKRRVAGVAAAKGVQKVARPAAPPRGVQRPGGLKRFGANRSAIPVNSPWIMPSWFKNGNNSADEWPPYQALTMILGPPDQDNWTYQTRTSLAFGILGTVKPDFLILQEPFIVVRVQSDRYHVTASEPKAHLDREQRIYLQRLGYIVIDIYPQHYQPAERDNGKRILRLMREAMNHQQRSNPRDLHLSYARG